MQRFSAKFVRLKSFFQFVFITKQNLYIDIFCFDILLMLLLLFVTVIIYILTSPNGIIGTGGASPNPHVLSRPISCRSPIL